MRLRRGFTLIELLVVVAIITLLMAILLPSLSNARKRSLRAVCGTNLYAIGRTLHTWASENNSKYPKTYRGEWNTGFSQALYSHDNWKLRQSLGNTNNERTGSYWGKNKIWACPAPGTTKYPNDHWDPGALPSRPRGYSNYMYWWSEPGISPPGWTGNWDPGAAESEGAPNKVGYWPAYYRGPLTSKDSPTLTMAQDCLWLSTSWSGDTPGYPYGASCHLRGSTEGVQGKIGSATYNVERGVFRNQEVFDAVDGVNILYNDGHVDYRPATELVPVCFGGNAKIFYIDVTPDMGYSP